MLVCACVLAWLADSKGSSPPQRMALRTYVRAVKQSKIASLVRKEGEGEGKMIIELYNDAVCTRHVEGLSVVASSEVHIYKTTFRIRRLYNWGGAKTHNNNNNNSNSDYQLHHHEVAEDRCIDASQVINYIMWYDMI